MKRPILCLLFLAMAGGLWGQQTWDLRQVVDYALAHNISIKQQDIQARLAELTYNQSRLAQYPNLNFSTSLYLNRGRSIDPTTNQFTTQSILFNRFNLQTDVEVFNFGKRKYTIESDRLNYEASKASVDKTSNDIALNVAGAYLQVLLNREQVAISRLQMSQTEAQLQNTLKLVRAGSLPELSAAQLEVQLASDSSNVVSAKGAEMQSLLFLKALLALDAGTPFDIVTPPVELIPIESLADLQPEAVYQSALANLPQQKVNTLRLRAAESSVRAARGAMYPSIGAGANVTTLFSNAKNNGAFIGINGFEPIGFVKGTNDTVLVPNRSFRFFADPYGRQFRQNLSNAVGVSVNVPIFNNGIARTAWQRAKLNVQSVELQKELDQLTIKQDIYKAYTDALIAMEKFNAAGKSVETAERAFNYSNRRYEVGLLNTIDLITSQSNLYRARLERILAQYDFVFKMKVLEFYKGQGLKL